MRGAARATTAAAVDAAMLHEGQQWLTSHGAGDHTTTYLRRQLHSSMAGAPASQHSIRLPLMLLFLLLGTQGMHMTALREVKLLRELHDPHIVNLLDVFQHKKKLSLVSSQSKCGGQQRPLPSVVPLHRTGRCQGAATPGYGTTAYVCDWAVPGSGIANRC